MFGNYSYHYTEEGYRYGGRVEVCAKLKSMCESVKFNFTNCFIKQGLKLLEVGNLVSLSKLPYFRVQCVLEMRVILQSVWGIILNNVVGDNCLSRTDQAGFRCVRRKSNFNCTKNSLAIRLHC